MHSESGIDNKSSLCMNEVMANQIKKKNGHSRQEQP